MKKFKTAIFAILTLLTAVYIFIEAPNLNPLYADGAIFWAFLITAYVVVFSLLKFGEITFEGFQKAPLGQGEKPQSPFKYNAKRKFPKWVKFVIATPWVYIGVMLVASSVFFNWKAYRDQLGEAEIKKFTTEVQAIDIAKIPVVDKNLAITLASKKLGERPSLGSQTMPGEPTIQMVNDELVWVVPLHHSGFFKWLFNMDGTPGYVKISATNPNKVDYVEGYKIKYHPYGYFIHDLHRHVRFTKGLFTGITDYSFELDDTGKPYWIVSTYKNKRLFALPEATGVIAVDATTGETHKYSIDELPDWIDRVQPEDFIIRQINNRGKYVNGIFNFSNKDKYMTSEGHNIVYNDGNNYLFTGLTSVGADESAMGFVMVDMVTKDVIQYQMSGATEKAAQRSAMGKVQDLGYKATFPIIVNILDTPTYFMTLKDAEGLVKQYAFVSIENYNLVGTGELMSEAVRDYQKALRNNGMNIDFSSDNNTVKDYEGIVTRISQENGADGSVYKFMLENVPETIFIAEAQTSDSLALTRVGDKVSVNYSESQSPIKAVTSFTNMTIFPKEEVKENDNVNLLLEKVTEYDLAHHGDEDFSSDLVPLEKQIEIDGTMMQIFEKSHKVSDNENVVTGYYAVSIDRNDISFYKKDGETFVKEDTIQVTDEKPKEITAEEDVA